MLFSGQVKITTTLGGGSGGMLTQKILRFEVNSGHLWMKKHKYNWCIEVPIEPLVYVLTTDNSRIPETGANTRYFSTFQSSLPMHYQNA